MIRKWFEKEILWNFKKAMEDVKVWQRQGDEFLINEAEMEMCTV